MSKVPTITPGPDDSGNAQQDATETLPLITSAPTAQQNDSKQCNTGISDDEAYAKLKTKRAERRHKKLVRRGIAAGIVGGMILIAIIVSVVLNSQPQSADGPVTDMVMEGTFTTTVEAKGQLKPISASVVSPSVDGTVAQINVQAGQSVNEGDVLMTIKNDELDNAVAEAKRAVAAAQEDLKTRRRRSPPHRQHRLWMSTDRPPRRMQPPTPAPSRAPSAISPRPRQPWTRQTPRRPNAP